jgi:2-polyprenyl-6-hydroxyphenyl methylase/3-demethylubiquinone-9 3-methyltransferase
MKHPDYRGGNGALSLILNEDGSQSSSYDPFPKSDVCLMQFAQFDLITAFELFEHVPDTYFLMLKIKKSNV